MKNYQLGEFTITLLNNAVEIGPKVLSLSDEDAARYPHALTLIVEPKAVAGAK